MKNGLTVSEEVIEIRIMTSKLIIIFEGGDALEVSRLPQRPMEKMSWNVFIGVVLGQIVSSYTLGIVGDALPTAMGAGSFSWPICSP